MKKILLMFICLCSFWSKYLVAKITSDQLYVTIAGGDLYEIYADSCSKTFIGSTNIGFGDIAITPNGKLWGILNGELYEIDPLNANTRFVGYTTGVEAISLIDFNDTILLAESNQNLYGIKTTDASTFFIGNIGYSASGDLTWYDNSLYMSSFDLLLKIVFNENFDTIENVIVINNTNNPIPTCEGLATISINDEFNSIIGFSGNNAYRICHIDGSFQPLCLSVLPDGIPGGANIRLLNQIPQPISCLTTSVLNSALLNSFIQIYPNPFSSKAVLRSNIPLNNATMIIESYLGKEVRTIKNIIGNTIILSNENLSNGIYFIRIEENEQLIAIKKIIIN